MKMSASLAQPRASSTITSSNNNLVLNEAEVSAVSGQVAIVKVTSSECGDVDPALCLSTLRTMRNVQAWSQMSQLPKKLPDCYKVFDQLTIQQHITF
jgi:hypothetical protein